MPTARLPLCFIAMLSSLCVKAADETKLTHFRPLVPPDKLEATLKDTKVDQALADFASGARPFPDAGLFINTFDGKADLADAGVPAGSVLVSRGPEKYTGSSLTIPQNLPAGDLVWVTPDNEAKVLKLEKGKGGGYSWWPFRNVPNWFLRHGPRDEKWDRWVYGALLQQDKNAALAESLWAVAVEKGYQPNPLSSWAGMMLALASQEYPRADAFATAFGPVKAPESDKDFPLVPADWQQLAFLTGNPKRFTESANAGFPSGAFITKRENAELQVEYSKATAPGTPSPVELAKKMKHRSFLTNPNFDGYLWPAGAPRSPRQALFRKAKDAAAAGKWEFAQETLIAPPNKFMLQYFSPPDSAANLDVEIRFKGRGEPLAPGTSARYDRLIMFGLVDPDHTEIEAMVTPADSRLLLAEISYNRNDAGGDVPRLHVVYPSKTFDGLETSWLGSHTPSSSLTVRSRPPFLSEPGTVHTLRVVRVGGQAEALIDGHRLALVSVRADGKNAGVYMQIVGSRIDITGLRADVLE